MPLDPSANAPPPDDWSNHTISSLRHALLTWFDANKRPLPWRENRDPYSIWVSEVMLQQTTVAAVVPYFHRFVAAFPTIQQLAAADEQEVLRHWEGLGYYRRARHLHAAARWIVEHHAGEIPHDQAIWAELPGVGRYILGAVLSQAFDRPLPIVEANSLRVLTRLWAYEHDPRRGAGVAWTWAAAEALLPKRRPGDHNQALMELGATVCTPKSPRCDICPARKWCMARKLGRQEEIPLKAAGKTITSLREVAVFLTRGNQLLLCRRSDTAARWANMWEVPHGEVREGETDADAVVRIAREQTGLLVRPEPVHILTHRHSITRYVITMVGFKAERVGGRLSPSETHKKLTWMRAEEMKAHPLSSPQRVMIDQYLATRTDASLKD